MPFKLEACFKVKIMATSFKALAELCENLENTSKRLFMIKLVAEFLKKLEPNEVEPAVSMILGKPFPKSSQKALEVSWATLREIIKRISEVEWSVFVDAFGKTGDIGSATKSVLERSSVRKQATLLERRLTIAEVRRSFEAIAEVVGGGSREKKERQIEVLLSIASPLEAKYLVKIFIGEMRTGFSEGLMEQAVSKAFSVPLEVIQKASMIVGDIGEVAEIARKKGLEGLLQLTFQVFRPVRLMLAQMVNDVAEALKEHHGKTAFEFKLDGARVQIHKCDKKVRIFSRRLADVTKSLPEIVEIVRKNVKAREAIFEGEVIAVDNFGNPIPFQHLMRRFKRVHEIENVAEKIPIRLYLFDILYLNGKSLISNTYVERRRVLSENSGGIPLTKQLVTENQQEAERFLREALDGGHEGLMAKNPGSLYIPGIRGKHWLKIKPVLEPLDLVIVAAEYGYGRRHSWLSDYYLAARNIESGEFFIVGKTFKGLTDVEMIEMTKMLEELAIKREGRKVFVIPKIVVEVAYNEIQKSSKYKCGMALRFARIKRIRYDKNPKDADTIQKVREIYEKQFSKKGRYKMK
jgi:DNA ligase-1